MMPMLDIIIVNWNSGDLLRDCLQSIEVTNVENEIYTLNKVIVVDNASQDSSIEGINHFGFTLEIIKNGQNIGFSRACNAGASNASGEYLLFLNPDTRLFSDSLVKPIEFMNKSENDHIGICGIRLVDEFGNHTTSYARFPNNLNYLVSAMGLDDAGSFNYIDNNAEGAAKAVDQIIGAFFLVRKSVYDALNGFDERFFVYFEEVDFSLRARQTGFSSYYLSDVAAFHKCGGCSDSVKSERLFYALRSRIQYGFKHFKPLQLIVLLFITLCTEFLARIAASVVGRSNNDLRETIDGYYKLYRYFIFSKDN